MVRYGLYTRGKLTQTVEAKNKESLKRRLSAVSRRAVSAGVIKIKRRPAQTGRGRK